MDKQDSSLAAETEALRGAYAALNRGDISGFVKVCHPQVERNEEVVSPGAGIYRGLEAVTAHLAQARGNWAEGSCEPERFITAGGKIIVFAHVHVRLKHEKEWREGDTADVYTFRDGKVIGWRLFIDQRQALAWAEAV